MVYGTDDPTVGDGATYFCKCYTGVGNGAYGINNTVSDVGYSY